MGRKGWADERAGRREGGQKRGRANEGTGRREGWQTKERANKGAGRKEGGQTKGQAEGGAGRRKGGQKRERAEGTRGRVSCRRPPPWHKAIACPARGRISFRKTPAAGGHLPGEQAAPRGDRTCTNAKFFRISTRASLP
eukprot:12030-Chlamydomonas_euryale.AAC.2